MIVVKISTIGDFPLLRQLPINDPLFEGVSFVYNKDVEECDFWFVYDKLAKEESCVCAPENIYFFAGEPPTVKHYRKDFLAQFAKVITCDDSIRHKGLILSHPFLPWLAGVSFDKTIKGFRNDKFWSYDDFKLGQFAEKSKLVSVITSNKTLTRGHRKRLDFVFKLKDVLGDKLDIYGSGFNDIPDKMDSLKDYKYSIVIENSQHPNYWTEKIADSFLCETFPIYFGCQNLNKYFPSNSFHSIVDLKSKKGIDAVLDILNSNTYEQNKSSLLESKQKVLNELNLFYGIRKIISETPKFYAKTMVTLQMEQRTFIDKVKLRIRWMR